jgi:hypothetical protein
MVRLCCELEGVRSITFADDFFEQSETMTR